MRHSPYKTCSLRCLSVCLSVCLTVWMSPHFHISSAHAHAVWCTVTKFDTMFPCAKGNFRGSTMPCPRETDPLYARWHHLPNLGKDIMLELGTASVNRPMSALTPPLVDAFRPPIPYLLRQCIASDSDAASARRRRRSTRRSADSVLVLPHTDVAVVSTQWQTGTQTDIQTDGSIKQWLQRLHLRFDRRSTPHSTAVRPRYDRSSIYITTVGTAA